MNKMNKKGQEFLGVIVLGILALLVIGAFMYVMPTYNVWAKEMNGKASLAEAEWDRQIQVKEAEANLESEKLNALSEIERAKGVAESNTIIGEGLKDNEEYLKYLWVKGLTDGSSEVIYIPTEANMPILEAGLR